MSTQNKSTKRPTRATGEAPKRLRKGEIGEIERQVRAAHARIVGVVSFNRLRKS